MEKDILADLNPPQKDAVLTTEGPVLIFAGAGAGKTKCLVHRLAYLVQEKKASLDQVLGITFTNKAAQELSGRILQLLGIIDDQNSANQALARRYLPWVGTFHSVAVRLLRLKGEAIGLNKNFSIFDDDDSLAFIKRLLKTMNLDPKQFRPQAIISNAKNELLSPQQFKPFAEGPLQEVAVRVYEQYQKLLGEAGGLDFDDLIFLAVRLLKEDEVTLKWCHQQFRYILIDEYQDTNQAQYYLTSLLTDPKRRNICVVGDDHQAIYGWRGANYRNILNFERDFPAAKVFKLEQNYRSTQTILAAANQIIKPVRHRSEKGLWTANEPGAPVTIFCANNAWHEAEFIATEIRSLYLGSRSWHDFAVLYRTNAQSRQLEEAFLRANVPYRLVGAARFYERKEIKDLLAYLRLLINPSDPIALNRACNVPPRGIGPATLAKGGPKVEKFLQIVEGLRTRLNETPSEILLAVIEAAGFRHYLLDGTPEGEARWGNVEELVNVATEYASLDEFLEHAALVSDVDNYDRESEAVTLMTLHASKGLEFTCVFIAGLEEGLFPHMRAIEDPSEMDEERRLMFVGMTRAKKRLYLLHARQRMLGGGITSALPSRFLSELDDELVERL